MRHARLKLPSENAVAAYHVISRTVNGERILDDEAKEVFRKQLWQVADYCGIQVLTYTILSNHFHLLVRVPRKRPLSDQELLRRYRVLYPRPTRFQTARLEVIQAQLATNGPLAVDWRQRQLALMGDLSPFVKLLKQRFSIWFNQTHGRFGTLWAERYKSDLIQPVRHSLEVAAAYIDLNGIRAGLVEDPKDYAFCGYAEAVSGGVRARAGLLRIFGSESWSRVQSDYRQLLYASGTMPKVGKARIPIAHLVEVMKKGGRLPLGCALLFRNRYFSDGGVLGSREFVESQLELYQQKTGRRRKASVCPLPDHIADWGGLVALRGLRKDAISPPKC